MKNIIVNELVSMICGFVKTVMNGRIEATPSKSSNAINSIIKKVKMLFFSLAVSKNNIF